MNVQGKLLFILLLGCAVLAQSAIAATIVAASDASASSKASAQYVCDGSNDQVMINSALAKGGEVVLTEGTFRTSGTIVVKGNSILRGHGPDKTVLSMAGDYAARVDIAQPGVTVSDLKITNRGWLMITTSNVKVHDVTIQDSKKTAPTVNGMFFVWADGKVCENIEFVRCKAIDVGSTGFNLNGQKSPRVNKNIKFEDCLALRCGNSGSGKIWAVGFDFHEGADLYDLYVNNCRAEDCWESGFYFEPNFYNGADPNTAIPVQVNSRVNNCIAVKNGWRNTEPTRFYMTGYYLSCGVTLNNCVSVNNKNNGFWVWQGAKDISLNGCTDDGSDKAFQVRTGTNMRFTNCVSKNARTYALYMWGTSGAVFSNLQIYNPKKTSGAVLLGLREDHPNDPWPVTGCTLDIKLSGADPNTLIRYYNAKNNQITINGAGDEPNTDIPTINITPGTNPGTTTNTTTPQVPPGTIPPNAGKGVIPGTIEFEDYDAGGEGKAYHETTLANEGEATYRQDAVDIEENDGAGSYVVGYCRPSEWLQYTVNVTTANTYDIWFKVASEKSGSSFKLAVDGTEKGTVSVPNTGSWNTFKEVKTQVTLTAGKHVLRVTMPTGYHNLDSMRFLPAGTTPTPTPTTTPIVSTTTPTPPTPGPAGAAIPGHIEAENYNTGGEGVAYHDVEATNLGGVYRKTEGVDIEMSSSEGSPVVGWVRPGEWLKYSVNVAKAGVYNVSFRVSSAQSDSSFRMQVDGADTCTVMVPNTGSYQTYTTHVQQVSLPAGSHVIRLYFNGYTNVNWIKFLDGTINTGGVTPPIDDPTTSVGVPPPMVVPMTYGSGIVPGVIQAEDFNTGGEGVGYYDTTASNFGGIYRPSEDVDIELNEAGNSPVVCYIRPGEWLKYTVNAKETGDYDVVFRVSSEQATTQMRLQVDGVTATTFTVPNTGGYETYTDVTQKVRLTRGPHVLRLVFGGYHNIDHMAFGAPGSLTASRAVADANTTAPTPTVIPVAIAPVTVATANVTTAVLTAATTNLTTTAGTTATANATMATTGPLTATPTANATAAMTATAMQAVTTASPTTTGTVEARAPAVPVPAVPTIATTAPKTTPPAAAPTNPATIAPSPQATEGRVVSPPAMIPATTATGTATATVTTAATTTAVANATPDATQTETTAPAKTLMQIAEADRNLTTFVNAVQRAGLTDTLNDVGPYTIFAPTDEAFEALPPGTLDALLADRDQLTSVLNHHMAKGWFMAADVTGMPTIQMLQGEPAPVKVQADGSMEIDGATVNQTDIQAGNGVIHVIDAVILPPDAIVTQTSTATSATTTVADATTTAMATTVDPTTVPPVTTAAETTNGTSATR